MKQCRLSRRAFLGRTASAAAVFNLVPRRVLGGAGHTPPSERLNIAGIGAGGQAAHDLRMVAREDNIVALCDVDDKRAVESYKQWPDVPKYKDFRVMLEKEKGIDAVVIAVPDHVHAVAAMTAMELGKHVYVEKPMAHSIPEVRALEAAAERYKAVTQMGNQGHSFRGCHILREWIRAKAIGPVTEVHCWTNRPRWPQGVDRPADTPPVPETLAWDLWLGPAPQRPYHPAYVPRNWRAWWDFGTCALGDMGCHILDGAYYALDLGAPGRVDAESSGVNSETGPKWSIIRYEFPKRGKMPPLTLTWYDGGKMPERPEGLEDGRRMGDNDGGALLVGKKGKIMTGTYGNGVQIMPETLKPSKTKRERLTGHHENWVLACKGRETARSNFAYASGLTELVLLGNIALRADGPIEWDSRTMQVTNNRDANQHVHDAYRDGWTL